MVRRLRTRFWAAFALALASAGLALLTVVSPTWIELLFGIDPDQGSGALEWALAALPLVTLIAIFVARLEWRRMRILEGRNTELGPTR